VLLNYNNRYVLVQVDWTRTRKQLIASAYALWAEEEIVPMTHAEITIGGPDVHPYVRTVPLQYLADRYDPARAADMLFVPMDDTTGGVSYFDAYVSKRDAENDSRYINVRVRLANQAHVLDGTGDDHIVIEVVKQTSRNKVLVYRPPPQTTLPPPQTMQPPPPPPQAPEQPPPPPTIAPQAPPPPAHGNNDVAQGRERAAAPVQSTSTDTSCGQVRQLLAPRKEMIRMDERASGSGSGARKRSSGHESSSSKRSRRHDSDSDDDWDLSGFDKLFGSKR
jgi:hypothetical protein